jgi:tetratricopeptide (TPR) repeat protein
MKKILLLITILFVSVMTTACINNLAIQELNNKAESYMGKVDTETAICRLKSSLDLDDEIYQTHYNLAVAYNTIGNFEGCIEELKRVLELKPDFYDVYYIKANALESLAYQILDKSVDAQGNQVELSLSDIDNFNSKATEAVENYNEYLVKKVNATETEEINNKIAELNNKIKEYTQLYDKKSLNQSAPTEYDTQNTELN